MGRLIRAELSNASARARVCLWQGNAVGARQCDDIRNGVLEHASFDTGSSNWTLTLISTSTTAGATVDLALDFNATSPTADLRDFRFQGTPTPAYNGYTAAVEASGTGNLTVTGDFDFGEQHSWHVVVQVAGQGGGRGRDRWSGKQLLLHRRGHVGRPGVGDEPEYVERGGPGFPALNAELAVTVS